MLRQQKEHVRSGSFAYRFDENLTNQNEMKRKRRRCQFLLFLGLCIIFVALLVLIFCSFLGVFQTAKQNVSSTITGTSNQIATEAPSSVILERTPSANPGCSPLTYIMANPISNNATDQDMYFINRTIATPPPALPTVGVAGWSSLPFNLAYPNASNQVVINVIHELYTTDWKLRWWSVEDQGWVVAREGSGNYSMDGVEYFTEELIPNTLYQVIVTDPPQLTYSRSHHGADGITITNADKKIVAWTLKAHAPYFWVNATGKTSIWDFLQVLEYIDAFPKPLSNASSVSNEIKITIQYDFCADQTQWTWQSYSKSDQKWSLARSGGGDTNLSGSLVSFTQEVSPNSLYHMNFSDASGDGMCCVCAHGWVVITNATASEDSQEGTVVWEMPNSNFKGQASVNIWADDQGRVQVGLEHPWEYFGDFPEKEKTHEITINVKNKDNDRRWNYEETPIIGQWKLRRLTSNSELWKIESNGTGTDDLFGPLESFPQTALSHDSLYHFVAEDFLWISITNGTVTENDSRGTVVWNWSDTSGKGYVWNWSDISEKEYAEVYLWIDSEGRTDVVSLEEASTLASVYPSQGETQKVVFNIQYDEEYWQTEWQLTKLNMNDNDWTLVRYNFADNADDEEWLHRFDTEILFESFEQKLIPNTLYHFHMNDVEGNGMRKQTGWISIINATIEEQNPKDGTVVWNVMGDAFRNSTEAFIWVDEKGHTSLLDSDNGFDSLLDAWNCNSAQEGP